MTAAAAGGRDERALFAITAPGLEAITAGELRSLGVRGVRAEPGGVAFRGGTRALHEANLRLRTASRVVVRVATFEATAFHELERRARRIDWARHLPPGAAVDIRVTCRKSRLYHSDAVAQRIAGAIAAGFVPAGSRPRGRSTGATGAAAEVAGPAQLLIVRILHDRVTISIDSSGELLHRRGYRRATGKAPLRETLAAAMLIASGWDPATPLVDPMCGAATIPIEGALLARRMAPGIDHTTGEPREFAFTRWPDHDDATWRASVARALEPSRPAAGATILAADRDAGAVASARANAERAGVAADIELRHQPLSALELPPGPGHIVTNPPYGVRVGERRGLRDLYARLGQLVRVRGAGWTLAVLSADRMLDAQIDLPLEDVLATSNGGIPVRLVRSRIG